MTSEINMLILANQGNGSLDSRGYSEKQVIKISKIRIGSCFEWDGSCFIVYTMTVR